MISMKLRLVFLPWRGVTDCYVSLIRKKFRWETIFLIGLKRYKDPKEEPIEKEPLMELKEIGNDIYVDSSYYRRFIANYSKVAKPLVSLTQKIWTYEWVKEQEEAFQTFKDNLCDAPILSFPDGFKEFIVYCDASNQGLGCVLMQKGKSSVKDKILAAPGEVSKVENVTAEMLRGMDQLIERKEDRGMKFIWVH
ncbi:putative reverse transcriptase domain-containing protein [Tanacetum coccineum]